MNIFASGRFWLAGPVAFFLSIIVMLGMALWFPKGHAGIDNIVLPMILFPLIWAVFFFYAYLDRNIKRVALLFLTVAVIHISLLVLQFTAGK